MANSQPNTFDDGVPVQPPDEAGQSDSLSGEDDALLKDLRDALGADGGSSAGGSAFHDWLSPAGRSPKFPSTRDALSTGSILADFEIMREIGRGGMGIVYQARQLSLNREVALKVLPDYSRHGRSAVRRFRTEAMAAARLNHTNVVPVYAQGEFEGHYYYAMKLVAGASLDKVIRSRPELLSSSHIHSTAPAALSAELSAIEEMPEPAEPPGHSAVSTTTRLRRNSEDFRLLAELVAGVADGLAHAHANGVIHRDIKPHNLLLGPDCRLHITDFGLAHLTAEPHLTLTGEVMGTPLYLAPEQARGEVSEIGERTDIYGLGVTLYELATGERAFDAESREMVLDAVRNREPRRPRLIDAHIPVDLETICLRAMEKRATDRYASAAELAADLRRFAEGRPIHGRRVTLLERGLKWVRRRKAVAVAIAAVMLLGVVGSGWGFTSVQRRRSDAERHARAALDRLVYLDYRDPSAAEPDLQAAQDLGSRNATYQMAEALYLIGNHEHENARQLLMALIDREPDNTDALYLLAWAHTQPNPGDLGRSLSQDLIDRADDLNGPHSAMGWFFRGLAMHWVDIDEAIHCYQTARTLRLAEHERFPQASLHLARAANQRMYKFRSLNHFDEARQRLEMLIEDKLYGAFPYYLLSLTYRIGAETEESSDLPIHYDRAEEWYAQAIHWAQEGEAVEPTSDRPPTALAEAYESRGMWEEAVEARTRAISLGKGPTAGCEGYHYRWRLYHWLGELDLALADVEEHRVRCMPESVYYRVIYPAVIMMEAGRTEEANDLVESYLDEDSSRIRKPLYTAIALYLLGRPDDAELALAEETLKSYRALVPVDPDETWVDSLAAYCRREVDFDTLIESQEGEPRHLKYKRLAELHFIAGVKALSTGDRERAGEHLEKAHGYFAGATGDSFHARWLSVLLAADPSWPSWIES